MSPTLQQFTEGLVMGDLDQVVTAVVKVKCETLVVGTE